jgi:hypothetical protein
MFVLTEDGKLYSFRITERAPDRSDPFTGGKARFTGELDLDPILVKGLPPLKQIATG